MYVLEIGLSPKLTTSFKTLPVTLFRTKYRRGIVSGDESSRIPEKVQIPYEFINYIQILGAQISSQEVKILSISQKNKNYLYNCPDNCSMEEINYYLG